MMNISVKKLNKNAVLPQRGSADAAGYDLCACEDAPGGINIWSGQTCKIHTGVAVAIPKGYFGAVFARSGLAAKHGLRPANCVGVIDSDYRGEILVALHNDSENEYTVRDGERIAQLVIMPCIDAEFTETDDLDSTERGDGGFGSTGTHFVSGFISGTCTVEDAATNIKYETVSSSAADSEYEQISLF